MSDVIVSFIWHLVMFCTLVLQVAVKIVDKSQLPESGLHKVCHVSFIILHFNSF